MSKSKIGNSLPLIQLNGVQYSYAGKAGRVDALTNINLTIEAGEMLAIVGPSGSGKSTLMNLLGCLDMPSSGNISIAGCTVMDMSPDALAALRRNRFGFVFQQYHLLEHLSAIDNVALPAVYSGQRTQHRHTRAKTLLTRLGMAERLDHKPYQLSGGQQQRVSIARALMNGGEVILADEPTGALDYQSGQEVLALLDQLHQAGHTVIVITHDASVAARSPRAITLKDGRIEQDTGVLERSARVVTADFQQPRQPTTSRWRQWLTPWVEAMSMAFRSMVAYRLRTALSVLGISIGIAAVVSIVAAGQAMRNSVETSMSSLMAKQLIVQMGNEDLPVSVIPKVFVQSDIVALLAINGVTSVSPKLEATLAAQYNRKNRQLMVYATAPNKLSHYGLAIDRGRDLTGLDQQRGSQTVILNASAADNLSTRYDPMVGKTIMLGGVPYVVVGVTGQAVGAYAYRDWQDRAFVSVRSFQTKLSVTSDIRSLTMDLGQGEDPVLIESVARRVLKIKHGAQDFTIFNAAQSFVQASETLRLVQLVLVTIAGISLLVGGISVMNMMLVTVIERVREIGICMAVGARQRDILAQYLIESILLCCIGGVFGLALAGGVVSALGIIEPALKASLPWSVVTLALVVSCVIGVAFGFFPARRAARFSPATAIAKG